MALKLFRSTMLAFVFLFSHPVVQAQDLNDLRQYGKLPNEAQLRMTLQQEPAEGMKGNQLANFYRVQDVAARELNDLVARERILRRWINEVPNNFQPRYNLWLLLITLDKVAEGLSIGETVVRDAPNPTEKARASSFLAYSYLPVGNFARARELLAEAEKIIAANFFQARTTPADSFYGDYAKMIYFLAKCELSLAYQKTAEALEQCKLADDRGVQLMTQVSQVPVFEKTGAGIWHAARAVLGVAKAQIQASRPFDASATAYRAMALAKSYGLGRYGVTSFYLFSTYALVQQHDFAAAQNVASAGLADSEGIFAPTAPATIILKSRIFTSQLGQGRWAEAQATLDALDRSVEGNAIAQQMALNVHPRAVSALMNGKAPGVLALLQSELKANESNFGADHLITGITRGLLGMALAESAGSDTAMQASAVAELSRAVGAITAPSSLGEDYADAGLRRLYRRLILEKYLELASQQNPDATAFATTFRVADYLRGSTVQRALSEAAARSAASTAGLADVVRRDQDAANEVRGLTAFIAEQSGREQERRVDSVVAQMKQRIAELEKIRTGLKVEIARQFPDYDRLVNPQPPSPAEVASRLADGEAFVSLLPTQKYVYVWAVSKSGTAFHRANLDDATLRALVQRLRQTLDVADAGAKAPRFDTAAALALYEQLFQPVGTTLAAARHWIVAPGGALGQVPMGVLLTGPTGTAGTPWLIRQAAISHVASASAWTSLNTLAKARPASEALAAWGDPLFDKARSIQAASATRALALTRTAAVQGVTEAPRAAITYSQIPALPETRQEIEAIASSLGANAANDAYFGERATRDSVLNASKSGALGRKRVVAFATHGLVPGDLPNLTQPALAMAANGQEQANPLSPLLTLEDVLTLKLNADWVVLSACNTAAADGKADEALSGLARGFFYAGSRSLLVTHWAVESESARQLTTATFEHYTANPQAPKAESLRQAMLKVMANPQYSHPAYWAPYALVGDGGR